jgi:hypothetical protein
VFLCFVLVADGRLDIRDKKKENAFETIDKGDDKAASDACIYQDRALRRGQ